jgi:CheY-like chemotaxis protein
MSLAWCAMAMFAGEVLPLTILVAEDEAAIRMLVTAALEDAGYQVLEAVGADEAIVILRQRAATVDVIFTDIHMPGGMDGLALAILVRLQWPWIAIMMTSGVALPAPDDMPGQTRFMRKPYGMAEMVNHVHEMIAAR